MKSKNFLFVLVGFLLSVCARGCTLTDSMAVVPVVAEDTTAIMDTVVATTIADTVGTASSDFMDELEKMFVRQVVRKGKVTPTRKEKKYDKRFNSNLAVNEAVGICKTRNNETVAVRAASVEARVQLAKKMKVEVLQNCRVVETVVIYNKQGPYYKAYVKVRME